jgi:hypothetical protein
MLELGQKTGVVFHEKKENRKKGSGSCTIRITVGKFFSQYKLNVY